MPDKSSSNGSPINVCLGIEYKLSADGIKSGTFDIIPVPALLPNLKKSVRCENNEVILSDGVYTEFHLLLTPLRACVSDS